MKYFTLLPTSNKKQNYEWKLSIFTIKSDMYESLRNLFIGIILLRIEVSTDGPSKDERNLWDDTDSSSKGLQSHFLRIKTVNPNS